MEINLDYLKKRIGKKAKEYANDKEKTKKLIDEAVKKAEKLDNSGPLEKLIETLKLLFSLIKDWMNGSYTEIPKGSIVLIIIGVIYFVNPLDVIPDPLPGGLVDDAMVLSLIIKQVMAELEKYKIWKAKQKQFQALKS